MTSSLYGRLQVFTVHVRSVKANSLAALLLGALSLGAATESQAVPAFARQTGMACAGCHFQTYPAINAFGRSFKASGYTLIGEQPKIEGDDLSLPGVLNASLVTKFRYQKTNGSDKTSATNTGELQFPDEAALLIGGRAGEHVGFVLELATFGEADKGSGEINGTVADTGTGEFSLFGSFKMPITYKVGATDLSFIPFTTDGGGAGYGLELLNTGAQRFQRVGEDRSALMAQQYLGLGAGAAEGFAFVAANPMGFVNVSLWAPNHGNIAVKGLAPYLRAAWTPSLGDWDAGFGVQYFSGKAKADDLTLATGNVVEYATEGWAIDGQLQGDVGSLPLGVYAAYANAPGNTPADPNSVFNSSTFDRTAWSIHGQLGVFPSKATVILGYRSADRGTATGNTDNALTVGGTYQLAQNVQLQLNHVERSGNRFDTPQTNGDRQTTLMLFSAF